MQVNMNPVNNQTNFGMAVKVVNENVVKIVKDRVKDPESVKRLVAVIEESKNNNIVDVNLLSNGRTITANICERGVPRGYFKHYTENFFTKIFEGPIGFIERMSKIANKQATLIRDERKMQRAIELAMKEQ